MVSPMCLGVPLVRLAWHIITYSMPVPLPPGVAHRNQCLRDRVIGTVMGRGLRGLWQPPGLGQEDTEVVSEGACVTVTPARPEHQARGSSSGPATCQSMQQGSSRDRCPGPSPAAVVPGSFIIQGLGFGFEPLLHGGWMSQLPRPPCTLLSL